MKTKILSSLNKIFKDTEPNFPEFKEFSSLSNEKFAFQIAFMAETKGETAISVSVNSPLEEDISLYFVENIPTEMTGYDYSDSFHYDMNRKEFPDLLRPIDDKIKVKVGQWNSIWVEYNPTKDRSGKKNISVFLETASAVYEKEFTLDIIDKELPPQKILFTNWFHNDCLCTYYDVQVFSDRYWEIVEKYIKNAVDHGVNMLLTPVFTPPLDTAVGGERPTVQLVKVIKENKKYSFDFENFRKYIRLCLDCGVEAFEISHFFTQWGAKHAPKIIATVNGKEKQIFGWKTAAAGKPYTEFLEAFSKAFIKEVKSLGIKDRCWLHVSDEPNKEQLKDYKKAADTLHRLFPGFNTFDALSDIEYYRNGLIKTPVCAEGEADIFRKEVKNFWTYYCCCQVNNFLPNRMFSQPSQRSRVLGVLLYKYDAVGFLQWGHNFWYSQYSKYPIDPYKVTDAGKAFPSGDAFVVYPGKDGQPLNSLRHEIFYDAFQDLRALRLLESLKGRDFVLNLIEEGLDVPLSFTCYPHEQEWLLNLRKKINYNIKNS